MNKSRNIAVFGCKSTTKFLIETLHPHICISHLITISPADGERHAVADYCDLSNWANERSIGVVVAEQYSLCGESDHARICSLAIDVALVLGWQRLIPEEVLGTFSVGAFGMHGSSSNLPIGRGRSPMNWSIIEGRNCFYTNLFRYDRGIDSGGIVDTFKFQIRDRDTAETLHFKNTLAMRNLIIRNIDALLHGIVCVTTQREDIKPTYYPKRSPSDGLIDWRQDVCQIERFIRAVTEPFDGAYSFVDGNKVVFWDSQVFDHEDFGCESELEGVVVEVFTANKILIKCFGGLLLVNSYQSSSTIRKGQRFSNGMEEIKLFVRNGNGFFDREI